ncbi:MAG TPA: envelope integrity protein Cei [Pseudonocardiaceae bacterium]|jgi:hypothetical protein|nr:envelope integrity protein Cei [Pseudonocardiaceae bacterium]
MTPNIRTRSDRKPYGRRRPLPALILLVVLATASVIVWVHVLGQANNSTAQARCPAGQNAPAKLPAITPLPYTALDNVVPAPAGQVRMRTLNASTQVGLADRIAAELQKLGFVQAATPANDPRYPLGDMRCFGQIRFGPNGESAARTVSLVEPCAQLVEDHRQDTSVDLALGAYSIDLSPTPDSQLVLAQLATWATKHPTAQGGLQSQNSQQPSVSPSLLTTAHTFRC